MTDDNKSLGNLNRSGRKPGSKNKSTLLREALKNGFEAELEKDFINVVRAVIDKAKDGDMTAAKMILDRAVPVTENPNAGKLPLEGGIKIYIDKLEAHPSDKGQMIEAEEGSFVEVSEVEQP